MIDAERIWKEWRMEREKQGKETETLDMMLEFIRPGSVICVRLPSAERVCQGWAEWSAYGTTY
jgi:hypothetical protein